MFDFLVIYDIKDTKRVGKIGRYLSKIGVRIEFSMFLVSCSKDEMVDFAMEINEIIDSEEDDVRIYIVEDAGIALGIGEKLDEIFVIR